MPPTKTLPMHIVLIANFFLIKSIFETLIKFQKKLEEMQKKQQEQIKGKKKK